MPSTSPARIDDDLFASAQLAGSVQNRSASQQVAYWARIGREIEASASISHKEITSMLAGSRSYDSLGPKEQAVVRAEWSARMDAARRELNLAADFAETGRSWVELDDKGRVVQREGAGKATARKSAGKEAAAANKSAKAAKASVKKTKARAAG